jgi:hypothetical protein
MNDFLTRIVSEHSDKLLMVCLGLTCGILPTSLINIGYLGFMVVLAYRLINNSEEYTFYSDSYLVMYALKFYSVGCISITYLALLQERVLFLTSEIIKVEGFFLRELKFLEILGLNS